MFEIMNNPQMLDYFKNNYLGSERAKKIFEIKDPKSFNRYIDNDYIGNGYGGYFRKSEYSNRYLNKSSKELLKACYEIVRRQKGTTFGDGSDDPRRN